MLSVLLFLPHISPLNKQFNDLSRSSSRCLNWTFDPLPRVSDNPVLSIPDAARGSLSVTAGTGPSLSTLWSPRRSRGLGRRWGRRRGNIKQKKDEIG